MLDVEARADISRTPDGFRYVPIVLKKSFFGAV